MFRKEAQCVVIDLEIAAGCRSRCKSLLELDAPDMDPFLSRWQVHEEDLVEAAFAEELRRKGIDLIRRGDDEDRVLFLLHPSQKCSEDALTRTRVSTAA